MEPNQTSENSDDDWNGSMNGSVILSELIGLVLLSFGMVGMFNGIEIGHPVYSVLFSNICFNFSTTFFNFVLVIVTPFKDWIRATIFTNFLGMLYHNTWYVTSKFVLFYRFCRNNSNLSTNHINYSANTVPIVKKSYKTNSIFIS